MDLGGQGRIQGVRGGSRRSGVDPGGSGVDPGGSGVDPGRSGVDTGGQGQIQEVRGVSKGAQARLKIHCTLVKLL